MKTFATFSKLYFWLAQKWHYAGKGAYKQARKTRQSAASKAIAKLQNTNNTNTNTRFPVDALRGVGDAMSGLPFADPYLRACDFALLSIPVVLPSDKWSAMLNFLRGVLRIWDTDFVPSYVEFASTLPPMPSL